MIIFNPSSLSTASPNIVVMRIGLDIFTGLCDVCGLCVMTGVCAEGWIQYQSKCYEIQTAHPLTWSQAYNYCRDHGTNGSLVEINRSRYLLLSHPPYSLFFQFSHDAYLLRNLALIQSNCYLLHT